MYIRIKTIHHISPNPSVFKERKKERNLPFSPIKEGWVIKIPKQDTFPNTIVKLLQLVREYLKHFRNKSKMSYLKLGIKTLI